MDLGVLNTIIAVVIVLLVLSLLVQAIQGFIKKILKLKSRQIVGSLEDLYDQALSTAVDSPTPAVAVVASPADGKTPLTRVADKIRGEIKNEPMVQALLRYGRRLVALMSGTTAAGAAAKSPAKQFTDKILGEFESIGRVTRRGAPILDSLSKEDLLKMLAKLESESLIPDYQTKFQAVYNDLDKLQTLIESLAANEKFVGAASAKLAGIRGLLAPVFNDVQSILNDQKEVKPKVLFGDLLRLGKLKLNGVPDLLNDAQQAITQEIEVAGRSTPPLPVAELQLASTQLAKIANLIGDLNQKFDRAVAPLRLKLEQVETWYDTVMQSFDERYARQMKNVAIYVSIVIVVLLNANFFRVYRSLSTNEVQKNLIVQNGPQVLEAAKKADAAASAMVAPGPSPSPSPSPSPKLAATPTSPLTPTAGLLAAPESLAGATPSATPAASARPNVGATPPVGATPAATPRATPSVRPTPVPSPSPSPTPLDIKKQAEEAKQNIELYVNMYEEFGFSPLSAEQARSWLWSTGVWTGVWGALWGGKDRTGFWGFTIARNEKGVPVTEAHEGVRKPIARDCHEIDNDGKEITDKDGTKVDCSPDWRPLTAWEWWASRKHDLSVLFGWSIMILLLSVGAPFWQDTLESLFGVKNLLRQKSGTQNIEKQSGEGQPKQS